ncbi:pimeloyl-CoA dehydrogenase large subunit, partial [Glaciimonas sp. Cout2]|nr:pimeloyl-CoA dehydrogenase large subunit [Glaciimonas sp. Cout2]
SYAQAATSMFCLVRTDSTAKTQAGISLLLIVMKTPGIKVRPILTLDEEHHVNEVFFDDVRVPVSDLLGEEGKGWSYGKVLL